MASSGGFGVPVVAVLLLGLAAAASAQLSATFYDASCPSALATIKSGVTAAVSKEARMGASLLRLHFHDCFVQGCDASVLLADTANFTGEQTAFPNAIRGPDVIDAIKAQVEAVCPQTVSCADILAVAARDSIVALGGPSYTVPLGRRDSTGASLPEANSDLPPPTSDLADLVGNFSRKGLSVTDMVALSAPETTEETYVEISDTEPEDPAASASTIDYPVEYYLDPSSGRYFVEVPPEDDDEIDLVQ